LRRCIKGNKIEAIKILRQERGVELKEAKDIVEEYISAQPLLQSKFNAAQAESKRGFGLWVFVASAALVYYLGATR
jgi:ribosomal protein L7/L12